MSDRDRELLQEEFGKIGRKLGWIPERVEASLRAMARARAEAMEEALPALKAWLREEIARCEKFGFLPQHVGRGNALKDALARIEEMEQGQ